MKKVLLLYVILHEDELNSSNLDVSVFFAEYGETMSFHPTYGYSNGTCGDSVWECGVTDFNKKTIMEKIYKIVDSKKDALLNLKHNNSILSFISQQVLKTKESIMVYMFSSGVWKRMMNRLQVLANITKTEIFIKHPITKKKVSGVVQLGMIHNQTIQKTVKRYLHLMKNL